MPSGCARNDRITRDLVEAKTSHSNRHEITLQLVTQDHQYLDPAFNSTQLTILFVDGSLLA